MLRWLVESVVFGFGASAGRDLYKGEKKAAEVARRRAAAQREAEIDDDLAALKKKICKR